MIWTQCRNGFGWDRRVGFKSSMRANGVVLFTPFLLYIFNLPHLVFPIWHTPAQKIQTIDHMNISLWLESHCFFLFPQLLKAACSSILRLRERWALSTSRAESIWRTRTTGHASGTVPIEDLNVSRISKLTPHSTPHLDKGPASAPLSGPLPRTSSRCRPSLPWCSRTSSGAPSSWPISSETPACGITSWSRSGEARGRRTTRTASAAPSSPSCPPPSIT